MISDDDRLAADLAAEGGRRLLALRAAGGAADELRRAGDRSSHEFLAAELARQRPGDAVLSEEGKDDEARLSADRAWIVDPLDGTREFGEPGRTDWAVHVALWERRAAQGAGDLPAGAVALPAQGRVLSPREPPRPPREATGTAGTGAPGSSAPTGRLRIVVSRTRAPRFVQDISERISA